MQHKSIIYKFHLQYSKNINTRVMYCKHISGNYSKTFINNMGEIQSKIITQEQFIDAVLIYHCNKDNTF